MSSVITVFKVHYNQKLGDPSGHLGGTHHGLWGIDAPGHLMTSQWLDGHNTAHNATLSLAAIISAND